MTGFVCDLDHDALPFRYCATKGCTWTDDATPPLVAASPVPPVVPDSDDEALDYGIVDDRQRVSDCNPWAKPIPCMCPPTFTAPWCPLHGAPGALWPQQADSTNGSGSGVVPDKPALAPDRRCGMAKPHPEHGFIFARKMLRCPGVVPAVTDDEAATEVIALGLRDLAQSNVDPTWVANEAVALLRSAGFLIVHHTKEA